MNKFMKLGLSVILTASVTGIGIGIGVTLVKLNIEGDSHFNLWPVYNFMNSLSPVVKPADAQPPAPLPVTAANVNPAPEAPLQAPQGWAAGATESPAGQADVVIKASPAVEARPVTPERGPVTADDVEVTRQANHPITSVELDNVGEGRRSPWRLAEMRWQEREPVDSSAAPQRRYPISPRRAKELSPGIVSQTVATVVSTVDEWPHRLGREPVRVPCLECVNRARQDSVSPGNERRAKPEIEAAKRGNRQDPEESRLAKSAGRYHGVDRGRRGLNEQMRLGHDVERDGQGGARGKSGSHEYGGRNRAQNAPERTSRLSHGNARGGRDSYDHPGPDRRRNTWDREAYRRQDGARSWKGLGDRTIRSPREQRGRNGQALSISHGHRGARLAEIDRSQYRTLPGRDAGSRGHGR